MCMQCKPTAGQCVLAIQPRSPRELQPAGFVFGCFRLFLQTIERGRLGLVACLSAVMAAMASMAASMRVGATNDVLSGAVGLGVAQWRASFCNPHAGRLQKQQIAAVAKHGAEDHHGRAAATAARAAFSDVIVEEQQYQVDADATMEVDAAAEAEVRENGLQRMRRTKLVCTIGPACSTYEQLELLASRGMNVARINMCHGTREWHRNIIRAIRRINADKGYSVAVMMDTEGSEIHMGDLGGSASAKAEDGEEWVFTVRKADVLPKRTLHVNYDGFAEDVTLGDELVVDGGMVRFEVLEKIGPDVHCRCIDPGLLLPRANLTFWRHGQLLRGRSAMLPTICSKDWIDIDFGIAQGVDFIAISFVKSADVIMHLRSYIEARSVDGSIGIIAKIESAESLKELSHIIQASDGAMVARGDLGAQIPLEQVPAVQQEVVQLCRKLNKPVIVASQMLESMIEYPMPTRAEVADISQSVRQGADALMLSGESAMGQFPEKALGVLCTASSRIEQWCRETKDSETLCLPALSNALVDQISEQVCDSAVQMANKLEADAIFVYTRGGAMASLVSRNRPSCPIFVFTNSITVRRKLSIQWGVLPFRLEFSEDMESNIGRTFGLLKEKGTMKCGDLVVVVSDIARSDITQSVQVRRI